MRCSPYLLLTPSALPRLSCTVKYQIAPFSDFATAILGFYNDSLVDSVAASSSLDTTVGYKTCDVMCYTAGQNTTNGLVVLPSLNLTWYQRCKWSTPYCGGCLECGTTPPPSPPPTSMATKVVTSMTTKAGNVDAMPSFLRKAVLVGKEKKTQTGEVSTDALSALPTPGMTGTGPCAGLTDDYYKNSCQQWATNSECASQISLPSVCSATLLLLTVAAASIFAVQLGCTPERSNSGAGVCCRHMGIPELHAHLLRLAASRLIAAHPTGTHVPV